MTRHFFGLFVLVVIAIAGVSWGQEHLWLAYSKQNVARDESLVANLQLIDRQIRPLPTDQRDAYLAQLANIDLEVELLTLDDITGSSTLSKLKHGEIAFMQGAPNESWLLKRLDGQTVLALKHIEPTTQRGLLEWSLALLFYAVIALVLMIWLWPLTRDLRKLEKATASFGNRNWLFRADIKSRSQIFPLAETFRKMAARIDGLISSHKDLSNAVSHEIKTPLSRMQFEIEVAQNASDVDTLKKHLANLKGDVADLNSLVTATLAYAVLERADMSLNIAAHDFTKIIPAVVDYVRRDVRQNLDIRCQIPTTATQVRCDVHLMETMLKNLVYNASRYAKTTVRVTFSDGDCNRLCVEDDGQGILEQDWQRVFGSFVQLSPSSVEPATLDTAKSSTAQLEPTGGQKKGFGLGLAIVKRAIEWHEGTAVVSRSTLGGACFTLEWPKTLHH